MTWLALRMLTGDRGKYLGLVFSVSFASMLMAHQASIFWGLMRRTTSQIQDIVEPTLWVMDSRTTNIDDVRPLRDIDLLRVRGVRGVAWAVPLYRGNVRVKVERDGRYRQSILLGVDDASLIGAPRRMLRGDASALRQPNAVVLDKAGYEYLWPGEPLALGRVVEINDRRAVVAGICDTSAPFVTLPVVYAAMSEVSRIPDTTGKHTSFVLAHAADEPPAAVATRIAAATGLRAMTSEQFAAATIGYYMRNTGIPVNFGITVMLAFIVGAAVAGQTFYIFTIENLKQLGALKAMGVDNRRIVGMILLQALFVGLVGYGIGMGLAAGFFESTASISHLRGFALLPPIALGAGAAVLVIVLITALFSVRRVLVLEPATVFRG